ncbi:hypothetical protein XI01_16430 [Bradyrhizobium sp. CCBAU 21360]|nr:hypothetical protein [Bradyrhizobium sp. CCBAU 21360]
MLHPGHDVEGLSLTIRAKEGDALAEIIQRCEPRCDLCSLSIGTILLNAALMQLSGSPLRLLPRPTGIFHNSLDGKRPQEADDRLFGTAFGKVGINQKRVVLLTAAVEFFCYPRLRNSPITENGVTPR